ncbi:MAG: divalent-cation tolerance protein CutA [Kiloniellales bacterium]
MSHDGDPARPSPGEPGAGAITARLVYITTGSEAEARRIGRTLVEERLAAGVNVIAGVTSTYWWAGAVQEASEAVIVAKTRQDKLDALTTRVREMHSYECPCVVALPIVGGYAAYFEWVAAATG